MDDKHLPALGGNLGLPCQKTASRRQNVGHWPLGCGKIWRRLFAKVLLMMAMLEVEIECGTDQLCGGLQAGIKGRVYAMQTT